MKKLLFLILCLLMGSNLSAQSFQDFLTRVNELPDSARGAVVDSFMNAVPSFPYIEQDSLAHFIFRGNASSVTVPGDANYWDPGAYSMSRISGTNFWYYSHVFEPDARLDYKFVLSGSAWILDPLNPNTVSGGFGPNSELQMPAYIPPPEIVYNPNIPHGTISDTLFYSSYLGNSRQVKVYTPPNYSSTSDSFGMILFHDGLDYLNLAFAQNVLDNLISEDRIQPVIAVFVPPVNRTAEYAGNLKQAFSAFIVSEVIPWIDSRYRTLKNPGNRATLGSSNGGNIALWLGLNHSDVFGNVAALSSNVQTSISSGFQFGSQLNLTFYLDIGTYDIPILVPLVENLRQILDARGYTYRYEVYHEGHSWGNWRAHIDNALEMFFPGPALNLDADPATANDFQLRQNFPNPFNASTIIPIKLSRASDILIGIFNVSGQKIRELFNGKLPPGNHTVRWDGKNSAGKSVPTGVYFYSVRINNRSLNSQKMMLLR